MSCYRSATNVYLTNLAVADILTLVISKSLTAGSLFSSCLFTEELRDTQNYNNRHLTISGRSFMVFVEFSTLSFAFFTSKEQNIDKSDKEQTEESLILI